MAADSTATTVWQGDLAHGSGVTEPASGAFGPVDVTWASRTARSAGKTSPEELLAPQPMRRATAWRCRTSSARRGRCRSAWRPTATVAFVPGEGVKSSHIVVSGQVPGIGADAFAAAAAAAGSGCPISGAMAGNVEITVDATLQT